MVPPCGQLRLVPVTREQRVCMPSTCHKIELRRWSDLATINAAIAARLPEMAAGKIGLTEIAELCKRDLYARPARDCDVRNQILQIVVEWDLDCDALEQQSNDCLNAIARFLQ